MKTTSIVRGFSNPALAGRWPKVLVTDDSDDPQHWPWLRGRILTRDAVARPIIRRVELELGQNCRCSVCAAFGRCMTYTTSDACAFCMAGDHRPERRDG